MTTEYHLENNRLRDTKQPPFPNTTTLFSTTSLPLPDNVQLWSVQNVQQWLTDESLGEFAPAFKRDAIDGKMLLTLTEEDLSKDLGVRRLPRQKILKFITEKKHLEQSRTAPTPKPIPKAPTSTQLGWGCKSCTVYNFFDAVSCYLCGAYKEGWKCPICTSNNKEEAITCVSCTHRRGWKCPICTLNNKEEAIACVSCTYKRKKEEKTDFDQQPSSFRSIKPSSWLPSLLPWGGTASTDINAVPLLTCEKHGKLVLDQKTARQVVKPNYSDPLVVVTFAGLPGSGKSTTSSNFNNFVYGTTNELFQASSSQSSFTKGSWIGRRPLIFPDGGPEMMLVDLEGLEQKTECYHIQISGMIFSNVVCYLSRGPRIDDNLVTMLNAVIGLKDRLKMVFEYPTIIFIMSGSDHNALTNEFRVPGPDGRTELIIGHDEYRRRWLEQKPIIAKAFGPNKIFFRTLSIAQKRISGSMLKIWENKNDAYYKEIQEMIELCRKQGSDRLKGIDARVLLLSNIITTLNSSRQIEIVNVLKQFFIKQLTDFSVPLLNEKKATLEYRIATDYENKNIQPMSALSTHYPIVKKEYEQEMKKFAMSISLVEEKIREEEIQKLHFFLIDNFYLFCRQKMDARALKEKEERLKIIRKALEAKVKVRPKDCVDKCPGCKCSMDKSCVVHINCKNGQDGIWYWLRRESAEKICENCEAISNFTYTVCVGCKTQVSTEVY